MELKEIESSSRRSSGAKGDQVELEGIEWSWTGSSEAGRDQLFYSCRIVMRRIAWS